MLGTLLLLLLPDFPRVRTYERPPRGILLRSVALKAPNLHFTTTWHT